MSKEKSHLETVLQYCDPLETLLQQINGLRKGLLDQVDVLFDKCAIQCLGVQKNKYYHPLIVDQGATSCYPSLLGIHER